MQDDQRRDRRTSTRLETIYFTETRTDVGYERLYYPGLIVDKSLRGLGMNVHNEHKIDDRIWLEGLDASATPRQACVRWVNAIAEKIGEYRIGVEILATD